MKRHRKHPKKKRHAIAREGLVAILERAKSQPLTQADFETLKGAVDTLAFLTQELEAKGASLQRLRHMLFGAPTEKTDKVLGGEAKNDASPGTDSAGVTATEGSDQDGKSTADQQKPAAPGHGRNAAASYTGAKKFKVEHQSSFRIGEMAQESAVLDS